MGGAPQYPRTNLPGLEFMVLAPNANVALSGRRRFVGNSPSHSVPASAIGSTFADSFLIESLTFNNMGMYLHTVDVQYIPLDATDKLQLVSMNMGASLTTGAIVYPFGQAVATFAIPASPITALTDRDKVVLVNDVSAFNQMLGLAPTGNGLSLVTQFAVTNNDTTAAHAFSVRISMIYAWLVGIIE